MICEFDGHTPEIGTGTYVSETALVVGNVKIGRNCYVGHGAVVRGDFGRIEIGEGTAVEEGVIIHVPTNGLQLIGNSVTLGHGAIIHGNRVGDFSVIGMGAVLSMFSETGEWSIVGEGAIVRANQKITDYTLAVGNPAKEIRPVSDGDRELWGFGKKEYIKLAAKYIEQPMKRIDSPMC